MRIEGTRVYLVIPNRTLGEDGPDPYIGGVDLYYELLLWIGMNQDGSRSESSPERLESFLSFLIPTETNLCRCQPRQTAATMLLYPRINLQ